MGNKLCIKRNESIFLIAILIFTFSTLLEMTLFTIDSAGNQFQIVLTITKLIRYFSYALCILKIWIEQEYSNKWILVVMFILTILAFGMLGSGSKMMFLYFWLIAGAQEISDKKILTITMIVQIFILCCTIVSSQIGIIEDIIADDRMRHFLGFTWTTTAPILFFYIILQYLYLKDMHIHIFDTLLFLAVSFWMFKMTNTRLTFIMSIALVLFAIFYQHTLIHRWKLEHFKFFLILFPEIVALFSICLHWRYNSASNNWNILNSLLSNRLSLGYNAIQDYGITFFGQEITWYGNGVGSEVGQNGIVYNYVDCSYLQILLQYGVIFLILVLVAYSVIIGRLLQKKRYSACWIICAVLVFAITEPRLVNLAFNPFILLVMANLENAECNNSLGKIKLLE